MRFISKFKQTAIGLRNDRVGFHRWLSAVAFQMVPGRQMGLRGMDVGE